MNKIILSLQFIIVLLLAISGTAYAQTTITIDDISFDAVNGEITGYSGTATDIIIPESFTVNGTEITVKSIQYYAFQNKELTSVSFPNTLTSIKFLSFADNLLTSVTLPPNLTELGGGAFSNNSITKINGKDSNGIFLGVNTDGSEDNTQLVCYGGTATVVDFIPSTITVIQSYAFEKCGLTSVIIPDGVVELHDGAFEGNELTTLILPNSVTTFHSSVFKSNKLTSIRISENLTKIGYYAFEDNLLTTIEIPEGVTIIKNDAFLDNQLTSVSLPSTLTEIYMGAFKNNALTSISLPSQLKKLGDSAFRNNKLAAITIPASVTNINSSAFFNNLLSAVSFEAKSNIISIAGSAFSSNASLTGIVMPSHANAQFSTYVDANGIEYVAGESISNFTISYRAKTLKTLSPDDVTFNASTGTISGYSGTTTDIIIPESFTIDGEVYAINEIANYAFRSAGFSSVIFPETLQKIGDMAFYQNNLTKLVIPEGCEVGSSCFGYNNIKEFNFPTSMTEIPSGCFSYGSFTDLTIPSTVKTIGSAAFSHNDIATLTLNEGLEEIGISAFYLNELTSVSIPNSVVLVDKIAFSRNKLTEVNVKNSVLLGGGAFANNKIVTVNGEPSDGLFYKRNGDGTIDKTKLTSYGGTAGIIDFLSDDITEIDNYAFYQCSLSSIILPSALSHIGSGAFYQTSLRSITIPNTLKYIGSSAFCYNNLSSITFPKSIEYIGSYAFGHSDFTSVTFENESNINIIEANAFDRNYNLDDPIVLPTSAIPNFINFYDNKGNIYIAGSGFLNDEEGCFAHYKKTLTLDDVEFDESTGTITDYIGTSTDIIIPESFIVDAVVVPVVNIGEKAFYSNNLLYVEMANSITTIETLAFYNNSSLEEVRLSTALITIGKGAFRNSTPASGIELPNTGTWHSSNNYTLGTAATKIESSKSAYYYNRVYVVNFVDHDATDLKTETLMLAASATAPDNPTRTAYTFTGWDVDFDNITEDITVTAEYIISIYTVSFEDYDGTLLKSEELSYGLAATAPSNPTRTGYTFTGWDAAFDNIKANTTVTAEFVINTFTVSFQDYDGTLFKSEEVNYSSAATAPSNPTRTAYTFTGWDVDFDNITEDITVTAEYIISIYTVSFEDYDGTLLKSEELSYGLAATAPSNPTRTGYTFTGWDAAFDNIKANTTVTAEFVINTFTVSFEDYDGTLLKSEEVNYSSNATAPSNPTRTAYTFTGWDVAFDNITEDITVTAEYIISIYTVSFEDYDGTLLKSEELSYGLAATAPSNPSHTAYTFTGWDVAFDNITEDITVTAEYTINSYTVRFENYDGTMLETQIVNYNSDAIAPSNPTRTGYSFTGWDVAFENISEDITVIAEYSINTYAVRFQDYDGTLLKSESVEYGSAATAPSNSSHTGYSFTGWDVAFDNIKANTTVTAEYTINSYTVSFQDFDGTLIESEELSYGSAATAPSNPTRTGYSFTGWDAVFDYITDNITVTAEYLINTYTVSFEDYDGTLLTSEELSYGSAATAPSNPTRTGYTFIAWDVAFDYITDNITVTAEYDLATGIEIITNTEYSVYPNPVRDILTIDLDNADDGKAHKISIYNNSGQLVYSNSDYDSKNRISVASWKAGMYVIVVNDKRTKIIKL
ncbi:MAG: leucine-rich repeat protein [Labilibaculum antarcticum]